MITRYIHSAQSITHRTQSINQDVISIIAIIAKYYSMACIIIGHIFYLNHKGESLS